MSVRDIRVHVCGAPRSGTTLMQELMTTAFDLDSGGRHEHSLLRPPPPGLRNFCSKWPDREHPRLALAVSPRLHIICMVRDPRDVVVSRHPQQPEIYWANLRMWFALHADIRRLRDHPRFHIVRYEDLVTDPDAVQARIAARIPALERRAAFSDFVRIARPSAAAIRAMGGLRDIDAASIGAWRKAPARVAGQIRLHGDVAPALIELGYEPDASWRAALVGVEPDLAPGYWSNRPPARLSKRRLRGRLRQWRRLAGFALHETALRLRPK